MTTSKHNILLIGAGPLGLELAVALKHANIPYTHLEANQIGATMQWWPHATRWFSSNDRISIAGVPLVTPNQEKATREEYLAYLRAIVQQFNLQIQTYTKVTSLARNPAGDFTLTTQKHINNQLIGEPQTLVARKVILTTGGTEHPNTLNIPGENLPHVSHYFKDPHAYFNTNLLIVGGRNSAVEAALRCHRAGARVHFSYRGPNIDPKDIKYWLYPEFSSLLKTSQIIPHFNTVPTEITPTQVTLAPTTQLETGNSKLETLPIDFVLLLTGYKADMSLAQQAGVTLSPGNLCPTFNHDTMESDIPNLYIAGTATAGTQGRPKGYKVFLENCHIHVSRILAHLQGHPIHSPDQSYDRPES